MLVRVHGTPAGLEPYGLAGRTAVVIDVLRATSSMVTALYHGARAIWPVLEPDDAHRLVEERRWARDRYLLGGERGSKLIPGFDLGNSPAEYGGEKVAGREVVITTTNGTRAIHACQGAAAVLIASFLNVSATATVLHGDAGAGRGIGTGIDIVCAGTRGRFDLCDAACAGAIVDRLWELRDGALPADDFALACRDAFRANRGDVVGLLRRSAHGEDLIELGMGTDLELCAALDARPVVTALHEGAVTRLAG